MTSPATQKSMIGIKRRVTKEKALKGDREEVWPPDVERAFLKALEVLPKLGRRKVLVNGKPCGRNELIADYIFKVTQKVRDRKQVSSHIQVLKNTRKHDPTFMRLLMDSGDGDDDAILEPANLGYFSTSHSPVDSSLLSAAPSDSLFLSDQQSRHANDGAVSPTHYPLSSDSVPLRQSSPCQVHTQYSNHSHDRNHHHRGVSSEVLNPVSDQLFTFQGPSDRSACIQSIYQQAVTTPDSAVSLSSDSTLNEPMVLENPSETSPVSTRSPISSTMDSGRVIPRPHGHCFPPFPLWPAVFRLFIRYPASGSPPHNSDINDTITNSSFYDKMDIVVNPSATLTHELAQAHNLNHRAFGAISIQQLPAERFPCLYDHFQKATCAFMYFKVTMDMNLEQECTFENTCLFDSSEDRVVRCWTMIYSFGKNVLKSTEVKQAGCMDGKFVHSFEFVNQFFDAFLSGIRTLGTSDEVEAALANLSLVQIYEDLDPRTGNSVPLLVMAFDFEQGQGSVAPHFITDSSEMLESVVS
ncbi:hypothetical protein BG011_003924 [Mortierella polycephala]|uniref:TEA domain-containing protein n=1 Tax=Mortierella polycephala TaxID=41804 RepID=A0A9P6Q170_9FUNG|nr:hypothetical protein BG011_003924 [Mortierella polycephala]